MLAVFDLVIDLAGRSIEAKSSAKLLLPEKRMLGLTQSWAFVPNIPSRIRKPSDISGCKMV